jgi:hypothetical protein
VRGSRVGAAEAKGQRLRRGSLPGETATAGLGRSGKIIGMSEPAWIRRFRAADVGFPQWARDAPHRSLYTSNRSGTWELHGWDRREGRHGQLTARPQGTPWGLIHRHAQVSAMSYDETLLAIEHSEHGDADYPAIRVLRIAGDTAAPLFQPSLRDLTWELRHLVRVLLPGSLAGNAKGYSDLIPRPSMSAGNFDSFP